GPVKRIRRTAMPARLSATSWRASTSTPSTTSRSNLQGRRHVLRTDGESAPGGPEPERQDPVPPRGGDPAPPRYQGSDEPGRTQGIGFVGRNRSAALQAPDGRAMKTIRLGPTAGPSHSASRRHAKQVTTPEPKKQ